MRSVPFTARGERDPARGRPRFRGRLMIPIRDIQGRVIAFTARQTGRTPEDDPAREAKMSTPRDSPLPQKRRALQPRPRPRPRARGRALRPRRRPARRPALLVRRRHQRRRPASTAIHGKPIHPDAPLCRPRGLPARWRRRRPARRPPRPAARAQGRPGNLLPRVLPPHFRPVPEDFFLEHSSSSPSPKKWNRTAELANDFAVAAYRSFLPSLNSGTRATKPRLSSLKCLAPVRCPASLARLPFRACPHARADRTAAERDHPLPRADIQPPLCRPSAPAPETAGPEANR